MTVTSRVGGAKASATHYAPRRVQTRSQSLFGHFLSCPPLLRILEDFRRFSGDYWPLVRILWNSSFCVLFGLVDCLEPFQVGKRQQHISSFLVIFHRLLRFVWNTFKIFGNFPNFLAAFRTSHQALGNPLIGTGTLSIINGAVNSPFTWQLNNQIRNDAVWRPSIQNSTEIKQIWNFTIERWSAS